MSKALVLVKRAKMNWLDIVITVFLAVPFLPKEFDIVRSLFG